MTKLRSSLKRSRLLILLVYRIPEFHTVLTKLLVAYWSMVNLPWQLGCPWRNQN